MSELLSEFDRYGFVAPQSADEALQRSVAVGRVSLVSGMKTPAQIDILARAQVDRKCLSCGADQSNDGALPCGH